ncbi:POU domain, class 5, transcription factor 1.1-like [Pseudophryne corroboree]|uniref:POU domain, class 5, transcription factor 1.1-like n=1 Tax=Pseudophryne corroboree TaxID=495146 RepID=UPI003081F9A5
MYGQQAYPPFTLTPGLMQEGFGGYPHPSQAYFFSAMKQNHVDLGVQALGEHPSHQVMSWNNVPQMEPSHPMNFGSPHQVRGESPGLLEKRKIKEESPETEGKGEEECPPAPPNTHYYPHCWSNPWLGSPSTQRSTPESNVYGTPAAGQSPNSPAETTTYSLESSRCNSAPTKKAAKKSSEAAVNLTAASSPGDMEEPLLLHDGEDVPDVPTQDDMEQFAKEMKRRRVSMGFTQADVGYALGVLYGQMFSQTTICRFESLQLSFKNMCQLKPLLHRWLDEAENNDNLQEMINRQQTWFQTTKRKRRTSIENLAKDSLEVYFMRNTKPNTQELAQIAQDLNMEKDVVRVWFCNRRQKGKRHVIDKEYKGYEMPHTIHPHMGVFSLPQEMMPQGYMSAPLGPAPTIYPPAFNHKNMFSQQLPNEMLLGNSMS